MKQRMQCVAKILLGLCLCGGTAFQASAEPTDAAKAARKAKRAQAAKMPAKKKPRYLETGGERKLNVVYKTVGKRELQLDLYYPTAKQGETTPVIFYTHGGGWAAGSRFGAANASFGVIHKKLISEGFAVVSIGYRLARKESGVAIRDCVIDAKDAMRYIAKNSDSLGLDPNRFFMFGDSAGGQMAQMLLLASPKSLPGAPALADASYKTVAAVSWYGPCDFEKTSLFNHDDRENFRDRFGPRILNSNPKVGTEKKLALYREMSPINYLRTDSPPLLMIQGDKDTTIPVKHAYYMQEKAKELKAPVEVMIIKNAGHNWRKVEADIAPTRNEIIEATVQFYLHHAGKISTAPAE